ncbi:MAG: hypothetical protein KC435_14260 [Thermomicrobiales bacterium]|nr:hypothetical protein [Thermomicrobiales bacterium]
MAKAKISLPKRILRASLITLLVLILAGGVFLYFATTPMQPGDFYNLPDTLPEGAPGTVIRSEKMTDRSIPGNADAWRVLYLSQDMHGEAIAISGMMVAPKDVDDGTPRDIISWATGTIGIYPECGVSHTRNPFSATSGLKEMIDLGYVVAITDYQGRSTAGIHPYLIGPAEAYAVLDAVRAARDMVPNTSDRYALWGESQGGHSAMWSAQMAPDYAPELELVAVAIHAGALDLLTISEANMDKPLGSFILGMSITAWSAYYPDAHIEDIVKPESRKLFDKLAHICFTKALGALLLGDVPIAREMMLVDPSVTEPWRSIMIANTPVGPVDVPILLTHGTDDPLIPIAVAEQETARRCADGESVTFVAFEGVQHAGSADTVTYTVNWLHDRMMGIPVAGACGE